MKKIVKQSLPLEVFEVTKEKALDYMKERQEDYKVEMIEELPEGETITFINRVTTKNSVQALMYPILV